MRTCWMPSMRLPLRRSMKNLTALATCGKVACTCKYDVTDLLVEIMNSLHVPL